MSNIYDNEMESARLCKKCGEKPVMGRDDTLLCWRVKCPKCGKMGEMEVSVQAAVMSWNKENR